MSFHKKSNTLIIIPAYNEEDNILKVVELSKKYADVCVVNDNSSDRTYEILKTINNIKIIKHTKHVNIYIKIKIKQIYLLVIYCLFIIYYWLFIDYLRFY